MYLHAIALLGRGKDASVGISEYHPDQWNNGRDFAGGRPHTGIHYRGPLGLDHHGALA